MYKSLRKYFIIIAVVLAIFTSGLIIGYIGKESFKGESLSTQTASVVVPDNLKGVYTFPAVGSVDVAFSPAGGITNMIKNEIDKANKSIQIQAYSFTSPEIIKSLIDAKKRGVDVRIILDKSNIVDDKNSSRNQKEKDILTSIVDNDIPLKIDSAFRIAHSKIMIIDNIDVITGSFNFTYSAEHNNAENCLILHDNKQLAEEYMKNWQWRWAATEEYRK